jgi:hypothetical protein
VTTDPSGEVVPEPLDLIGNPGLRAALQVARSWGARPGAFFGDAELVVTDHEYDSTGRLVRTVTSRPGWTEDDRELAYALADFESDLCGGCGLPLSETTRKEHSDAYVAESDEMRRCHYCTALETQSAAYEALPQSSALHLAIRLDPARVARNRAFIAEEEARRGTDREAGAAGARGAE